MQFSISAIALAFASLTAAMPTEHSNNALESQHQAPRFKVPDSMTVEQAQAKCGDQAQLSCCNKAVYAGDTTDVNSGALGGVLSNLIGSGSGASGLGVFDQCSKLDAQSKSLCSIHQPSYSLIYPQSPSSLLFPSRTSSTSAASRTSPAVPTRLAAPTPTVSVPAFLVLPSAPFCKRVARKYSALHGGKFTGALWDTFLFLMFVCLSRDLSL
jgi:hypothetical protein